MRSKQQPMLANKSAILILIMGARAACMLSAGLLYHILPAELPIVLRGGAAGQVQVLRWVQDDNILLKVCARICISVCTITQPIMGSVPDCGEKHQRGPHLQRLQATHSRPHQIWRFRQLHMLIQILLPLSCHRECQTKAWKSGHKNSCRPKDMPPISLCAAGPRPVGRLGAS